MWRRGGKSALKATFVPPQEMKSFFYPCVNPRVRLQDLTEDQSPLSLLDFSKSSGWKLTSRKALVLESPKQTQLEYRDFMDVVGLPVKRSKRVHHA